MSVKVSANAEVALETCHEEAQRLGSMMVEPEHLLLALLALPENGACRMLTSMGRNPEVLRTSLREQLKMRQSTTGAPRQSPATNEAIARAHREANRIQCPEMRSEHLLLGLIEDIGATGRFLKQNGISLVPAREEAAKLRSLPRA